MKNLKIYFFHFAFLTGKNKRFDRAVKKISDLYINLDIKVKKRFLFCFLFITHKVLINDTNLNI